MPAPTVTWGLRGAGEGRLERAGLFRRGGDLCASEQILLSTCCFDDYRGPIRQLTVIDALGRWPAASTSSTWTHSIMRCPAAKVGYPIGAAGSAGRRRRGAGSFACLLANGTACATSPHIHPRPPARALHHLRDAAGYRLAGVGVGQAVLPASTQAEPPAPRHPTSTHARRPALSITFSRIPIMRCPSAKVGYSIGAAGSATLA